MKVKRKIIFFFIELEMDNFFFIFNSKQNIFIMKWNTNKSEIKAEVKLIVHGRELPFKTKNKVKLICSWPETAIQNRKLVYDHRFAVIAT